MTALLLVALAALGPTMGPVNQAPLTTTNQSSSVSYKFVEPVCPSTILIRRNDDDATVTFVGPDRQQITVAEMLSVLTAASQELRPSPDLFGTTAVLTIYRTETEGSRLRALAEAADRRDAAAAKLRDLLTRLTAWDQAQRCHAGGGM